MRDLVIEEVTPDLACVLARLHAESFSDNHWGEEQIKESLNLDFTKGLVAKINNEPIGFILYQVMGDELEILTFCVSPLFRRKGIGERLLSKALAFLPPEGKAHLEVAADNIAACRLYEKHDFVIAGKRPCYYRRGNKTIDAIRYVYKKNTKK